MAVQPGLCRTCSETILLVFHETYLVNAHVFPAGNPSSDGEPFKPTNTDIDDSLEPTLSITEYKAEKIQWLFVDESETPG